MYISLSLYIYMFIYTSSHITAVTLCAKAAILRKDGHQWGCQTFRTLNCWLCMDITIITNVLTNPYEHRQRTRLDFVCGVQWMKLDGPAQIQ